MRILFGRGDNANGVEIKQSADDGVTIWPVQARMKVASGGRVVIPAHADDIELVALELLKIVSDMRETASDEGFEDATYIVAPARNARNRIPAFAG